MNNYVVEVIDIETEEVIRSIPCPTRPRAERVEQGVLININMDKYYTNIRFVSEGA